MKVIKITAMWCSACIIMNNIWDEVKKTTNIEEEALDYDFDSERVKQYEVGKVLPVFILVDNNKEIKRIVGEHSKDEMLDFIKE